MKHDKRTLFFGIGIGLIMAATIFFMVLLLTGYNHPEKHFENSTITDEEIIDRAEDLGMIKLSDFLEGNYEENVVE